MLGHDVHRHLGQVHVLADAGSGRDARLVKHLAHQHHREGPRIQPTGVQIPRDVDEHLVDGVHVHVLRGDVPQVDLVDLRAPLDIERHARRGCDVVQGEGGVRMQFPLVARFPAEPTAGRMPPPLSVDGGRLLDDLE